MSLITRLLQEVSEEEKRTGESQCFIGHEFRHKDLRVKLERALDRLGLQAYFADKEVTGEFILTKVCKKILVTRASIVDLTTANPNVYFELGVAIGLNKPVFVVLKQGTSVPPLLENFVKLRFTHYAGLERELVEQVPGWLEQSIEHHLLYNTHCHFVNVLCPDRQRITPQRRYLVIDQIESTDEAGQPILTHDPDLRAELPAALDRFHFDPVFLADVPLDDDFRLCDYCRILRDSSFALCHLTRCTSPNVYLLLGLVTGLNIPSLLMVHGERDKDGQPLFEISTMLRGLDAFYYEHSVDIGERLGDEVEGFLNRQKSKPILSRTLAFPDLTHRLASEEPIEGELEFTTSASTELLDELISSSLDLDELLVRVVDKAVDAVGASKPDAVVYCDILLLDESEQKLTLVASRGSSPLRSETHFEVGRGVFGWVALNKEPALVNDVSEDYMYIIMRKDVKSELAVPLIDADGQLVGVINLESPLIAYFTEEDTFAVQRFARLAATAIQRAKQRTRSITVRETLSNAQSITDPVQQANALVALLDELAEIRDTEGIRRVIEIALTITVADAQVQVLQAASRAYENLGESEKTRQVAALISSAADDGFAYDVFISYSHQDRDWVFDWLVPGLQKAGLRVYIDQETFRPGAPIMSEIQRAVETSRVIIPVLTSEYLAGDWSNLENIIALSLVSSTRGRRIIPVLLRQTELPPPLRDLMLVDFTQPGTEEAQVQRLIAAIRDEPVHEQLGGMAGQAERSTFERMGEWLKLLGFVRYPFMELEAEREPNLPEYFVEGPFFAELLTPRSSVLFAARGHGKTAYRRLVSESLKGRNGLVVHYTNFGPPPVTWEDHMRALIKLVDPQGAITSLLESASPVEVFARTCEEVLERTDQEGIYILVDRIDESAETASSGQVAADLVLPLLTQLHLMELPGVYFKFFLPLEIKHFIIQSPGFRRDRIAIFELQWTETELLEMLRSRLLSASDGRISSIDEISHEKTARSIDKQLVEASAGSPRRLILLGQQLLEAHLNQSPDDFLLTNEDLREVLGSI